jgi:hypothetical protein
MNEEKLVEAILKQALPIECGLAGDLNLREIVRNPASDELRILRAEGGSNLDLGTVLTLLISAATLCVELVKLYHELKCQKRESSVADNAWKSLALDLAKQRKVVLDEDALIEIARSVKSQIEALEVKNVERNA